MRSNILVVLKDRKAALQDRTKKFALEIIRFVDSLPSDRVVSHMGHQLLKSGTSVAANYRSACRGRSNAELYSKLCICKEEADEAQLWLELLVESGKAKGLSDGLIREASELTAIFVSSKKAIAASGIRESTATYGIS